MESGDPPRPRKRRRAALSCEQCRQRKLKCDRNDPCGACVKSRLPACVYKDNSALGTLPKAPKQSQKQTPSSSLPGASDLLLGPSPSSSKFPPSPAVTQSPISRLSESQQPASRPALKRPRPENDLGHSEPLRGIRGSFAKRQLYGESHWMSYLTKSSIAIEGIREIVQEGFEDGFGLLRKCKTLAREIKAQERPDDDLLRRGESLLPTRPVADMLIQAYLRSLETVFHILDVQQFSELYEQYWHDPNNLPRGFHTTMILVFAVGAAVCPDHGISRKNVTHWIFLALQWLGSPRDKLKMDLWSLRTHCLLLIARHANGIDGKMTSLSAGSCLVTAMHMGLHVDPVHFAESQVPRKEHEIRRRLWATVLELEVQANMDSGGRPLIRDDDFDCAPPNNIDESEISGIPVRPAILPTERYTKSSVQILLARSVPIRLRIVRFVNDFRPGLRYQEALALSKEFVEEMRRSSTLIETWRKANAPITQFEIEIFQLFMHRSLLALHYSYALKAKDEPLFYYSRKVCLDSALAVLAQPLDQQDADFYRLILHGRSVYGDVYAAAANFLTEYIYAESSNAPLLLPAGSASPQDNLIAAMENILPITLARIESCQTNVKGHLLFSCLLAFAKAVHRGTEVSSALRSAIQRSLQDSYDVLRARFEGPSPMISTGGDLPFTEDVSLENLFSWMQGDSVFGSAEGDAWLHGLDWGVGDGGAMVENGLGM
ncbi:hypothetical protein Q7P37_010811 [Cladosporium fusiforme]